MPKIKEFGYKKQETLRMSNEWQNKGETDKYIMKKKKKNYVLKIEGAIGSQNSLRTNLTTTAIFTLIINDERIALDNYGFIVEDKNLDLREEERGY
jgi:Ni,Fe-hydrogenase I small subunit